MDILLFYFYSVVKKKKVKRILPIYVEQVPHSHGDTEKSLGPSGGTS